jgi:hypothetical protein
LIRFRGMKISTPCSQDLRQRVIAVADLGGERSHPTAAGAEARFSNRRAPTRLFRRTSLTLVEPRPCSTFSLVAPMWLRAIFTTLTGRLLGTGCRDRCGRRCWRRDQRGMAGAPAAVSRICGRAVNWSGCRARATVLGQNHEAERGSR